MAGEIVVYTPERGEAAASAVPAVINRTDETIVRLWLAGRSQNTKEAYAKDAQRLFDSVKKPLEHMTLEDLQAFAQDLEQKGLAAGSRKRILAAVKSLFTFASDGGIRHVRYNVAAALRLPKSKDTLNERILTEEQVALLITSAGQAGERNRLIVELLYLVGMRAEELTNLCWRDARPNGEGGLLTVFGKGEKTRHLHLEPDTWAMLTRWRGASADDEPIFKSREGGGISTVTVWRIVSGAAHRAGLKASPHWLRHAHATHAIDHGCELRMLQQSLGHASSVTTERYIHSRPKKSSGAFVKLRR